MTVHAPPAAAVALLRRAIGVADAAEGILGDLTEEFQTRCADHGRASAVRWFWLQSIWIAAVFRVGGRRLRCRVTYPPMRASAWLDELAHAARSLRRSPAFTALSVAILGLGIGTATAVFSAFRAIALAELPVSDPDRLVTVSLRRENGAPVGLAPDEIDLVRREVQSLSAVAGAADSGRMPLTESDRPLVLDFAFVTADFFDVLGARPALGRLFRPEDGAEGAEPVAVISYRTWRLAFGGQRDAVGRHLTATQYQGTYTIVGVAPPGLEFPVGVDYWILPGPRRQALRIVARLDPGITPESAGAELVSLAGTIEGERAAPMAPTAAEVESLREVVLGDTRPILLTVAAAGGLLLLIACANVGNLLLMRASRRARAIMVRRALGASPGRIARLLLLEAALLGTAGGALGLLCASGLLRLLPVVVPTPLPRSEMIDLSGAPVGVAVAVTLSAVLLVGILPALPTSRSDPAASLRGSGRWSSGRGQRRGARRALVACQVALAVVVLFGAGLLVRTLRHLGGLQLGYQTAGVALIELGIDRRGLSSSEEVASLLEGVFERVRAVPGVTSVTPLMARPYTGSGAVLEIVPVLEGQSEDEAAANPRVPLESGGSELFRTLGIPILRGRELLETDREEAPRVAVVSQALAERLWPNADPIGERIRLSLARDEWWTVVGVAGETRFRRLREVTPTIYLPWRQFRILPMAWTVAARTEGDPSVLVPAMSRATRATEPRVYVWQAAMMEDHLHDGPLAGPRTSAILFSSFGLAALLLAAVGLYGVMALAVQERTHDLGVRRALGAQAAKIRSGVLRDALATTLLGGAVGLALALAVSRMLSGLLHEVPSHDVVTVLGVCALLAAVSFIAAYVPARRATRVDPMVALRAE